MMPIENLRELSGRLISCKHFKWMPGMLAIRIYNERKILTRLVEKDCEVMIAEPSLTGNLESGHIDLYSWNNKKDLYLDLEDPATGGLILHLLGEICSTETKLSSLSSGVDEWEVWTIFGRSEGRTLGEAAAKALIFLEERSS